MSDFAPPLLPKGMKDAYSRTRSGFMTTSPHLPVKKKNLHSLYLKEWVQL